MHGDLGLKAALQQASPGRWFYVTTLSPGDTLASELMAVEKTFTGLGQGKQHIPMTAMTLTAMTFVATCFT